MIPYERKVNSLRLAGEDRIEVGRITVDNTGRAVFPNLESGKYELYIVDGNDKVYTKTKNIIIYEGENKSITWQP